MRSHSKAAARPAAWRASSSASLDAINRVLSVPVVVSISGGAMAARCRSAIALSLGEDGGYVTAQLVHLGVALSCYAGYFSSK